MKEAIGVDPELIRAAGGKFEVMVNGQLVYSKLKTNQFPDEESLVGELKSMA